MRLGRYELLYRLAKGGMGEVFVARRRGPGDIEKRVVIKRIRRDLSGNPRFVEMFLREAKVSMTLSHKNIAAVFDFGRVGQELFLAMEHVHGRDLARALKESRKKGAEITPAAAAHIGIEVCRALDYAQRSQRGSDGEPIIHRDLSPKNLLLSFSGEVVVADFGLAIESGDQLGDGSVRGTPAYMSPEQARGESLDVRSDLFSLGLILHEIVSGKPSYEGESPKALIQRAREADLEPLAEDVPAALRAVIETATHAELDARFANPRAMQQELDKFLIGARAAGAAQPAHEIAEWLGTLFDEADEPHEHAELGDQDLAAVTFLDDGDEAVARDALSIGDETMASMAETVGDSELDSEKPDAGEPGADLDDEVDGEPAPAPRRGVWLVAGLASVFLLAGGVMAYQLATGSGEESPAAVADASATPVNIAVDANAPAAIDAAPELADAAPLDARVIDAAAPPAVLYGALRVQSQPWARVSVRGSAGCAETPCRIKLRAGKHTARLVNPITGAAASRSVTIRPNETTDLTVVLPKPQ